MGEIEVGHLIQIMVINHYSQYYSTIFIIFLNLLLIYNRLYSICTEPFPKGERLKSIQAKCLQVVLTVVFFTPG